MKVRGHIRRSHEGTSISIPKELLPQIDKRAAALQRNKSNYIVWLVTRDLELAQQKQEVAA